MADGSIIINTQIDTSGVESDLGNLGGKLDGVAKKGLNAFTTTVAAARTALVGLGTVGVKYNAEMEQYMSGFTTMLGSAEKATEHLNDLKKFAASTPFELSDLAQASTTLLAFGTDVNDITPDLKMLGDIALGNKEKFNSLALVFGQVSSQGKLTGGDLMQMVNAGFNPLLIMSEKSGKSMSELKDEMSKGQISFEMVADAMKTATSEGGQFYNAMEGQSQTLVGQWSTLSDNATSLLGDMFKPISDALTNNVLPAINGAIESISESLSNGELQDGISKIAEGFANMATSIAEGLVEWLPKIIETFAWLMDNSEFIAAGITAIGVALLTLKVVNTVSKIGGIFKSLFLEIATGTPIMKAFNIVMGMNPYVLIAAAVIGLVAGFIYLWNTSEGFRNFSINMWESIKTFFIESWNAIMGFFTETIPAWIESIKAWFSSLSEWFGTLWEGIKQWFINGWNAIVEFFTVSIPLWWASVKQAFADGWNAVVAFFTETIPLWLEQMGTWFLELPNKIAYALGFAFTTIVNWGIETWNSFTETCTNIYNTVTEWFSQLPGRIWEFITNAYNSIVEWGTNTWNKFVETCTNVYNSVTEWFAKLPGMIWNWLKQAIDKAVQWGQETYWKMVEAVANAINAVIEWFAKLPGRIWEWLVNTVKKVIDWGKNLGSEATKAGGYMVKCIIDAVKDLPKKFMDIGVNIVKGIWEGIKSVGSWLHDRVTGFFDNMLEGARDANKICSPSKLYRDEVGKYMAQGVGVGFEDEADNVQKSMEKEFDKMAGKMQLAVDYNMASTTAGIVARNNSYGTETRITTEDIPEGSTFVVPIYMDSEKISEYTYKKTDGKFALAGKRVR